MSYPVAVPDRRLLTRRACTGRCLVYAGTETGVPAILHQLDGLGARLRLLEPLPRTSQRLRIVLEDGVEVFGAASWRIGDFVGIRRMSSSAARAEPAEQAQAA